MIKQYFAEVRLLTKDVYIWWFRHNIWVIIPEDSRMGYAMTAHTDLVRDQPHQPTTEILFKDIVVRRLGTDPQTLKDFFFDRCITTKGQEKLHAEEIMGAVAGPVDDD
ncbi:uncharacterized protein CCOS01_12493 [Colletotrichum costaricense]|uniref:Uncharacterized protein n=1 Tax=Colletotrichum costaricense TaxID=1209916 RepID=A0AAI9YNI0_9PEZI|nr:uncharacterized protein CCOS01_12493 [Colletotrichum costaricense]KAK1516944.1 hypothetical protein CCOS01_12493 [Colletotrichum costaricense]